jgi:hypothetical protein
MVNQASAGVAKGMDGKNHPFGSDAWQWNRVPVVKHMEWMRPVSTTVRLVPHHHFLAAKRFCLLHVDHFVREMKANEEDHVRLANLCSRGLFHHVWKLTGGEEPKLTHHGYESVHEWEKEVREAAEHLSNHGIPSEEWRKHLMGLSNKK